MDILHFLYIHQLMDISYFYFLPILVAAAVEHSWTYFCVDICFFLVL